MIVEGIVMGAVMVTTSDVLKEVEMGKKLVDVTREIVHSVEYTETLGFAGIATDNPSKAVITVGIGGMVGALFAAPFVAKALIAASLGCFAMGFARGVMKSRGELDGIVASA